MRNSKLYWINVYIKTENIHYILSVSYHGGTHTVGSSLFEGKVVVVGGGGGGIWPNSHQITHW